MVCAMDGRLHPRRQGWIGRGIVALALLLATWLGAPRDAAAWWNSDWTYREKITIDAGPKGAALSEDPGRMPLLLRLHDGNFQFLEAKEDASDLRVIAGDDKTPLKFHIESYDGVLGVAFIWIDVPVVALNAPTEIWLYWGNPGAASGADMPGTYDSDTTLVYHFAERNAPPRDSTASGNNAAGPGVTVATSQIGSGLRFDGTSALALHASPSLAIAPGGAITWSAWVKPGDPQANAVIFAKSEADRSFVVGLDQNVPYVSIADGATTQRTTPGDAITPGTWHHIAVTASDKITLFIDGQARTSLALSLPALAGAGSIGGVLDANGALAGTGFAGELDEVEISKVARNAGFIGAAFASQGAETKFVTVGGEEQHAGWFSGGYFGVILKSVTTDGWVVIGMLMVMAVISWVVMVTKSLYVNRVARANGQFLDAFTRAGGDFERFEAAAARTATAKIATSSLYRIYRAGADELKRRFATEAGARFLTPQAIATIRAILDRVTAQEGQRLNRSMVLLTIAISGGPFLGLLGTVVGVMITFAAIAATGDVNITAIAPGMAAALVATVAGLGVAIPALFGYNYLISRIKDTTADMHVFVDEFTTRLAETYRARHEPENLAAE